MNTKNEPVICEVCDEEFYDLTGVDYPLCCTCALLDEDEQEEVKKILREETE